jgi:hypothetical protein
VGTGRDRNDGRIDLANQRRQLSECSAFMATRDRFGSGKVRIDDTHQLGIGRVVKHTKMVGAECAGADNGGSDFVQLELLWSW